MSRRLAARPVATLVATLVAALVVARSGRAWAHQTSVKYVDLAVDGAAVAVTFRVTPGDVTAPMGLPVDATPTAAAAASDARVAPFVARWLTLRGTSGSAGPCVATSPQTRVDDDGRFVVIAWRATCPAVIDQLVLDFGAFFAFDARHAAIVRLSSSGAEPLDTIVHPEDSPLTLRLGEPPPASAAAWIRTGMDHIYDGDDHIRFVLALLLVVFLIRPKDGDGWALRGVLASLRATAGVITAFTIAHSLTLIAASFGWVRLPGAVVETMIAVSIAYTALEDLIRPDVRWRFALTFGFGLVHGLGFASVLAELLPPHDVVVPLLLFNVGVEIGQLTIVLVALPLLLGLARVVGAARYRAVVMPILALGVFCRGVIWTLERAGGGSLGLPTFGHRVIADAVTDLALGVVAWALMTGARRLRREV
jgi:hypothetical protein